MTNGIHLRRACSAVFVLALLCGACGSDDTDTRTPSSTSAPLGPGFGPTSTQPADTAPTSYPTPGASPDGGAG